MSAGNWKEMYFAAEEGNLGLVRYHLESGIDPNFQHPEIMSTVLCASIKHGHIEVVKLLLESGADPRIKTLLEEKDAWQFAALYGRHAILELLGKK